MVQLFPQLLKNFRLYRFPELPRDFTCELITRNIYQSFMTMQNSIRERGNYKSTAEQGNMTSNSCSLGYDITDFKIQVYNSYNDRETGRRKTSNHHDHQFHTKEVTRDFFNTFSHPKNMYQNLVSNVKNLAEITEAHRGKTT